MKKTKKLLMLLAVVITVIVCFTVSASALGATGQCGDNVYWEYNSTTGELVISGTGAMTDYESDDLIFMTPFLFSDIESVVIENSVTTIGNYAFAGDPLGISSLKKVTIGNSVTTIGDGAFEYCSSLTEVTIPDSVTTIGDSAFYYCDSLTDVYYGGTQEQWKKIKIGSYNSDLTDANIHYTCYHINKTTHAQQNPTCTSIGYTAGIYCPECEKWVEGYEEIPATGHTDTDYDKYCDICEEYTEKLYKSGKCGDNVTYEWYEDGMLIISGTGPMTDYEDYNSSPFCYSNIKSVVINEGVTTIGDYAFAGDVLRGSSLTEVTIPDSVTTIGAYAFYHCDSLTEVTIPDSVTTIGAWAFAGDVLRGSSLTKVTIGDSVTTIGDRAFSSGHSLTDITVDENNQYFSNDEYGVLFNKDKTTLIQYPTGNKRTSYTIPDSVTTIGDYAFYSCNSLTEVTIPDSVKTIGNFAFAGDVLGESSLTKVTIGDSVTTIGDSAFYLCRSLTEVTIGDSVTTIGDSAFCWCYSLTDVYYGGTQEQWKKIKIGSDNGALTGANIHFNYAPGSITKPSSITPVQSTTSAIKLTWSAVPDSVGYRVYQKVNNGWKALGNVTKTSATLTKLTAGTKYTFAVQAIFRVNGALTLADDYTTISTATKTSKPSTVKATQTTSTIKLTWSAVNGADGYKIFYKVNGKWKACVNSTTATSHTFKNLKAGAKYTFAIQPYIKTDSGVVWGEYAEFTTATLPATVTVKATSPSIGNITISWNQVSGSEGYQIWYRKNGGSYKLYKTVGASKNAMSFSNLTSGTKYTFAVRAGIKTSGGNIFGAYKEAVVTVK